MKGGQYPIVWHQKLFVTHNRDDTYYVCGNVRRHNGNTTSNVTFLDHVTHDNTVTQENNVTQRMLSHMWMMLHIWVN